MLVKILLSPETFTSAARIARAARSTKYGLNVDSGLGGSFPVVVKDIHPTTRIVRFRAPKHGDFPASSYAFTQLEARDCVFALHPGAPFIADRPFPIGGIIPVCLRAQSIARLVEHCLPAGCTIIRILTSVDEYTIPIDAVKAPTWVSSAERSIVQPAAGPSPGSPKACYVTLLNQNLVRANRKGAAPAFTFHDLYYKRSYFQSRFY